MLTITQDFLTAFPKWVLKGWAVGDTLNIVSLIQSNQDADELFKEHPPKKPNTP